MYASDQASALSFTFTDECNLVALAYGLLATVQDTGPGEVYEVLLLPQGLPNYVALICSVTPATTLDCAMGSRDFAACPTYGDTVWFENGPQVDCGPVTLTPLFVS